MATWFEVSVRYTQVQDNGTERKVTDRYLCEAETVSEAENRALTELGAFLSGEIDVRAVKDTSIAEVFTHEGETWYKCKVIYITLDEKSGKEKETASTMMVAANDITGAIKALDEGMHGTMADWRAAGVAETKVVDVWRVEK